MSVPVPVTQLLLVVDMQKGLLDGQGAIPNAGALRKSVSHLISRARTQQIPVIFLQNDGEPGTDDEPETLGWRLALPVLPEDAVIRKTHDDGFRDTDLAELLSFHSATSIAVVGAVSEMCVAATIRSALSRGFDVVLPHDGHGTYDVPAGPGDSVSVPAALAARAAEWSLGDEVIIVASVDEVRFAS